MFMSQIDPRVYRSARILTVQAIFEHLSRDDETVEEILDYYKSNRNGEVDKIKPDQNYFTKLFLNTTDNKQAIIKVIEDNLSQNWKIERVDQLLIAILMVGISDIMLAKFNNSLIISEYIRITEAFFAQKECNFVNKILDKAKVIIEKTD